MSHGPSHTSDTSLPATGIIGGLASLMRLVNSAIFVISSLALIVAALVLTEGVLARNLWGDSSEWQEEVTVFLLLGAMLMLIIGMSLAYANTMSSLNISQAAASAIVSLQLSKWLLLAAVLIFTVVLGFFLPPVSIILMTASIILRPLKAAGFDLVWFGVVMTIVMEMGLIHPPVGLNIFVIRNIAPDIPLRDVIMGTLPFVILMAVAIVIVSLFPGLAMALPNWINGS